MADFLFLYILEISQENFVEFSGGIEKNLKFYTV